MIAASETLQFGPLSVTVREWTLAEIRAYLASPRAGEVAVEDAFLVEGFFLPDIPRFTNLTMADLDGLAPTQLAAIAAAIKRVNADFFRTCALAVSLAGAQATTAEA